MTQLYELLEASFKGAKFLGKSWETTGGRKKITHEYPNTKRRFVEDIGKLEPILTMEGVIAGPNSKADRDTLIEALESEGNGILVHPEFGSLLVSARPYTVRYSDVNLGRIDFSLTFEITADENIYPEIAKQQQSIIASRADNALIETTNNFVNNFKSVKNVIQNFNDAKNKINGFIDNVENLGRGVRQVASKINQFANDILNFRQDINNLLIAPQSLASSISNLYQTLAVIAENPFSQFSIFEGLYNFGDDDEEVLEKAQISLDRKNNRDEINTKIQIDALVFSYDKILDLDFETTTQINNIRQSVENQYEKIVGNENFDLSQELKNTLQDLREGVQSFLDDKELTTPRVIQIETIKIPLDVLVYKYYGNLDNFETIKGLNSFDNISFIEGTVNILSQ